MLYVVPRLSVQVVLSSREKGKGDVQEREREDEGNEHTSNWD